MKLTLLNVKDAICKLVLFDPNLTVTLTENQTSSLAMETLCMAVEAYLSPKANFFSDMIAEKSVELMGLALNSSSDLAVTTPLEVLLSQGGCLASLSSSCSSIGAAMLLSMCIHSRFRVSQSIVAAILLPYAIEDATGYKSDRLARLASLFKIESVTDESEDAALALAENIRQRLAKANLPTRLKDLALPIEQLSRAAEDAGDLDLINTLPRSMSTDDLFAMIKSAY